MPWPRVTSSPAEVVKERPTFAASAVPWLVTTIEAAVGTSTIGCVEGRFTATPRSAIGGFTGRVTVTVSGSGSGCCSGVVDVTFTVAVVLAACAVGVAETATGTEE